MACFAAYIAVNSGAGSSDGVGAADCGCDSSCASDLAVAASCSRLELFAIAPVVVIIYLRTWGLASYNKISISDRAF